MRVSEVKQIDAFTDFYDRLYQSIKEAGKEFKFEPFQEKMKEHALNEKDCLQVLLVRAMHRNDDEFINAAV